MDYIKQILSDSISVKQAIIESPNLLSKIDDVAHIITDAFRNNHKVLFCGNGGSAADAQHLAAEFSGRFAFDRPPLYSEALHVNTSFLTAVANDYSFNHVYARMIEASGYEGDVLVVLSTSGNSENIIKAVESAKNKKMITVALSGETGGKLANICDYLINVPSTNTARIQESHITIGHIICQYVENELFK